MAKDVYNDLSAPKNDKNQKWNFFLFSCCIVASLSSFAFGYNIGVCNLPTPLVKGFYEKRYLADLLQGEETLKIKTNNTALNETKWAANNAKWHADAENYNQKVIAYQKLEQEYQNLTNAHKDDQTATKLLEDKKIKLQTQKEYNDKEEKNLNETEISLGKEKALHDLLKKVTEGRLKGNKLLDALWTVTNVLFVVGGVIGAFTSKFVAEGFGRKKSIVVHYIFGVIGGVLTVIAPYINSPECIIIGRFLFGIQGGMTCGLIPGYLNEISPKQLRGSTGVMQQLMITIGILISQVLGIKQILGTPESWNILLAGSIVPSVLGGIVLLLFFPDSPSSLINRDRDEDAARKSLEKLRQSKNVSNEIDEIKQEMRENKSDRSLTVSELFTTPELRWPLITAVVLQLTQQLSGVNAIFFYSESIFKKASIPPEYIQYAVLSTGVINVLSTFIALPLIDKLGRKPLLVFPLLFIVVDFIVLTFFLIFKEGRIYLSYLSIVCIVLFIVCFAVGLGPIPFVYCAEVFKAEARSTALAIAMFTNWMANLILTLVFPYMNKILEDYTFLVFTVIVAFAVAIIIKKVPETKGRTVDEIMASFDHRAVNRHEESSGKLMSNTNI